MRPPEERGLEPAALLRRVRVDLRARCSSWADSGAALVAARRFAGERHWGKIAPGQARLKRRFRPASREPGFGEAFLRLALVKLATSVALLSLLAPALAVGKNEPTSKNYATKLHAIRPEVQGLDVTTEGGDRYLVVKNDTGKTTRRTCASSPTGSSKPTRTRPRPI